MWTLKVSETAGADWVWTDRIEFLDVRLMLLLFDDPDCCERNLCKR